MRAWQYFERALLTDRPRENDHLAWTRDSSSSRNGERGGKSCISIAQPFLAGPIECAALASRHRRL